MICFLFSELDTEAMVINVPISKPSGYNSSIHSINVDLHLDPMCRYTIRSETIVTLVEKQFRQNLIFYILLV